MMLGALFVQQDGKGDFVETEKRYCRSKEKVFSIDKTGLPPARSASS